MGKGGEKSVAAPVDVNNEVLIDGRFYDVSKMKHPGGSVIKFYAGKGIDATQAFDNFHLRSKKAKKILEHLPSRAADKKELEQNLLPGQASLLDDFNQLSRDCKSIYHFLSCIIPYKMINVRSIFKPQQVNNKHILVLHKKKKYLAILNVYIDVSFPCI